MTQARTCTATFVALPPPGCGPGDESACEHDGGTWEPESCTCHYWWEDPLVIALDGHHVRLTNVTAGVPFDVNGDGVLDRAAWTVPAAQVGFLVLDLNANGLVDSQGELFGQAVSGARRPDGPATSLGDLAAFDRPEHGGNADGVISAADAVFAQLRIWVDADHDGVSQPGELLTLAQLGIASIELSAQPVGRRDRYGNYFRARAVVHFTDGHQTTIWDVFLAARLTPTGPSSAIVSSPVSTGLAGLGAALIALGLTAVVRPKRRTARVAARQILPFPVTRIGILLVTTSAALLWPSASFGQTWQVVEYYDSDALGSIRAVTDQQGQIVARHDFLPFGEELNPKLPPHDKKLFTGQERDFETGQDYFNARQLRPDLGRFLTPDPIALMPRAVGSQGLGAYIYVLNDPLGLVDPSGLDAAYLENMPMIDNQSGPTAMPEDAVFDQMGRTDFLRSLDIRFAIQQFSSNSGSPTEAEREQHQFDLVVEKTNALLSGAVDEEGNPLDARDYLDPTCRLAGGNCAFKIRPGASTSQLSEFKKALNRALGEVLGDPGAHGGLFPPTHRYGFYISLHHNDDRLHVDHFNGGSFPIGTVLHFAVDVVVGSLFYGTHRAFGY